MRKWPVRREKKWVGEGRWRRKEERGEMREKRKRKKENRI